MKKNKIKIQITGVVASGKSTVANLIIAALKPTNSTIVVTEEGLVPCFPHDKLDSIKAEDLHPMDIHIDMNLTENDGQSKS